MNNCKVLGVAIPIVSALLLFGCNAILHRASRAEVILTNGETLELNVTPATLNLDPVISAPGAAKSVAIPLPNIARVSAIPNIKGIKVELLDGSAISGFPSGALEGDIAENHHSIGWLQIAHAEFTWCTTEASVPETSGMSMKINGDGISPLELHSVRVLNGWVVRHGTHAYQRSNEVIDMLPFSIPRVRVFRSEWEIPVHRIQSMTVNGEGISLKALSGDGGTKLLHGIPGSAFRKYYGEATFVGTNKIGKWTLSFTNIERALHKYRQQNPDRIPEVSLEFFGDRKGDSSDIPDSASAGSCTTWDSERFDVSENWFEQLRVEVDGQERKFAPSEVSGFKIFENPWMAYDHENAWAEQWILAKLTLTGNSSITGKLADRFGWVTCRAPGGFVVHIPSYSLREFRASKKNNGK